MKYCTPSKTPIELNLKLENTKKEDQLINEHQYRNLVGSRFYLAEQTRPDIVWLVNVLSRFMDRRKFQHWNARLRMLRYLQVTKTLKMVYSRDDDFNFLGGSDADRSGDVNDRRSTTGYLFKISDVGGCISWQPKKQQTVALSSCEAEYGILTAATQDAVFLKSLVKNGVQTRLCNNYWRGEPKLYQTSYKPCFP